MKILKGKTFNQLYQEKNFDFWVNFFKNYQYSDNFYNYFFLKKKIINFNYIKFLIKNYPEIYFEMSQDEKETAVVSGKFKLEDFDEWLRLDPEFDISDILKLYSYSTELDVSVVEKNLGLNWDFDALSYNPKITTSFIIRNLECNWNWVILSNRREINWVLLFNRLLKRNHFVSIFLNYLSWENILNNDFINKDFIIKHRTLPWGVSTLEKCYKLTIDEIIKIRGNNIDFYTLSGRSDFTHNFITDYCRPDLNWKAISYNCTDITYVIKNIYFPWQWKNLSLNMDIKTVEKYIELPWDFYTLTYNKNLSESKNGIQFVKKHLKEDWDWFYIAREYFLNKEDILELDNIKLIPSFFSYNKNLITEDLLDILVKTSNSNLLKNVNYLNNNPNLSIKFVLNNPQFNWNFTKISEVKDLKLENVMNNLQKGWNWNTIACRFAKEITSEQILRFPIYYLPISPNNLSFKSEKNRILKEVSVIKSAVRKIERAWYKCTWDPEYKMCTKLFLKKLESDGVIFADE